MNLRSKKQEEPDINLTPLIDVVFLMLIFFMVSTTFEEESAVQIDLPKASSSEQIEREEAIEVTVSANGEYYINRTKVLNSSPDALKVAIIRHAGSNRNLPFTIRGDQGASWQSMVTVMDIAGQLGFSRLSMPTVQTTSEK